MDLRDSWPRTLEQIIRCRACAGLGKPVSGYGDGPVPATVLLIGEAPGRLGAARTGVPLTGDRTGQAVDRFLERAGIPPGQVHRTNALLCHPADGRGRNRSPRPDELARCVTWLARRLALVQPSIVVPLGGVALAALDLIEPHGLRLKEAVAIPHRWRGRWLLPLYHLSPRTIARRPMWQHEADWAALGDLWRRVSTLMPEMANAGEQHRDAGTVGRGNDFGVPAASPRLHDG